MVRVLAKRREDTCRHSNDLCGVVTRTGGAGRTGWLAIEQVDSTLSEPACPLPKVSDEPRKRSRMVLLLGSPIIAGLAGRSRLFPVS
jgi:hypothetical protein